MSSSIQDRIEALFKVFGCAFERAPKLVFPLKSQNLEAAEVVHMLNHELDLCEKIASNAGVIKVVRDADQLLEEIANRESSASMILDLPGFENIVDTDRAFLGLTLYDYLSSAANTAKQSGSFSPISSFTPQFAAGVANVSSAMLRLYLVLTFFRGDPVLDVLNKMNPEPSSILGLYQKLFAHEYTRHVRNALAHGHVKLMFSGLYIRDRDFEVLVTPGMIEKLCIWLWMFYYNVFVVSLKSRGRAH